MHNRLDWRREDHPGTKSKKKTRAKRKQGKIESGWKGEGKQGGRKIASSSGKKAIFKEKQRKK